MQVFMNYVSESLTAVFQCKIAGIRRKHDVGLVQINKYFFYIQRVHRLHIISALVTRSLSGMF